jgi:acyl-CoA synthetase (AMP-forming)/AMP-acid ligase II
LFVQTSTSANLEFSICVFFAALIVQYGLLTMFESVSDTMLSWLPWYKVIKLVLLVWCFSGGGAHLLYAFLLRPLLHRHQGILAESASITHNVMTSTRETSNEVLQYVRQKKLSLHSLAQMTLSSSGSNASAAVSPQPAKEKTSLFTIHDESAQPSSKT